MYLFKLKFKSALHVDSKGSGEPTAIEEFIHSDTLSAAIALAWAQLFDEKDPDFFFNLPFKVSSGFPYIEDVLLFPVPYFDFWEEGDKEENWEQLKKEVQSRKKIKKINWLSKKLFLEVIKGKKLSRQDVLKNSLAGIGFDREEIEKIKLRHDPWIVDERQRVSIDRLGLALEGSLFFFGLQFFSPESGLYFLAKVKKGEFSKLEAAVNFLGDSGIGADRNCGLGHFSVKKVHEISFDLPGSPSGWIILSLFNPIPEELSWVINKTYYELISRSGWIFNSTFGRPPVMVFAEGSCFFGRPRGRILPLLEDDLRKKYKLDIDHSAPRDFRAFALPCVLP